MFLILKLFLQMAHEAFVSDKGIDQRTAQYPLVSTPWGGLCIVVLYLLFVLKYGPEWMKHRKPYSLKFIIRAYNLVQVILNSAMGVLGIYCLMSKKIRYTCIPVNKEDMDPYTLLIVKLTYTYYLTKYIDLLDTIFFVLRKKNSSVNFLHVYHHSFLIAGVYYVMRHYAGSHVSIMGLINSYVHVVMYSYYLLTTYRPDLTNVWWKKYLTVLQLIQFVVVFIHFSLPLFVEDCNVPRIVSFLGMTQTAFMMALFSDFYIRAYVRPKKKQTTTKTQ